MGGVPGAKGGGGDVVDRGGGAGDAVAERAGGVDDERILIVPEPRSCWR